MEINPILCIYSNFLSPPYLKLSHKTEETWCLFFKLRECVCQRGKIRQAHQKGLRFPDMWVKKNGKKDCHVSDHVFIIHCYNEEWQSNLSSQADRWEKGPFPVQVICMNSKLSDSFGATMRHQAANNCTEDYFCLPSQVSSR